MNTLILDSTNIDLNVGLCINGHLYFVSYPCWQQQSEKMIPEIDKLLKEHNLSPKDINEVLVTNGPGSYTGVRIALTIAKVYCYALKIPCYVFSSLEVLMNVNKPSICLINARSNRSYFAVYDKNKCLIQDEVKPNNEVLNFIKEHPEYKVCGDLEYLNLKGYKGNLFETMLLLKSKEHLVKDIFTLKAIYLKD